MSRLGLVVIDGANSHPGTGRCPVLRSPSPIVSRWRGSVMAGRVLDRLGRKAYEFRNPPLPRGWWGNDEDFLKKWDKPRNFVDWTSGLGRMEASRVAGFRARPANVMWRQTIGGKRLATPCRRVRILVSSLAGMDSVARRLSPHGRAGFDRVLADENPAGFNFAWNRELKFLSICCGMEGACCGRTFERLNRASRQSEKQRPEMMNVRTLSFSGCHPFGVPARPNTY